MSIHPEKIQAIDMDSMDAPIAYSFHNGTPSTFANYFVIDSQTGTVKQIKPVDVSQVKRFDIVVKVRKRACEQANDFDESLRNTSTCVLCRLKSNR